MPVVLIRTVPTIVGCFICVLPRFDLRNQTPEPFNCPRFRGRDRQTFLERRVIPEPFRAEAANRVQTLSRDPDM